MDAMYVSFNLKILRQYYVEALCLLCIRAKNVLEKLKSFIKEHKLFDKTDQIAIAISGGKDSVFAAYVFNELKLPFTLVHCNFKLRGQESNEDEQFVSTLATNLKYCQGIFTKSFDTEKQSQKNGTNIQETARTSRYNYFTELYTQKIFTKIITAHHKNDAVETFFINLNRGSGINGLKSIPISRDFIIRPLLAIDSNEIAEYLKTKEIEFKEDSSNKTNKYLRNKLRNKIIPSLKNEFPNFENRVTQSIGILQEENQLLNYFVEQTVSELSDFESISTPFKIAKNSLLAYPQASILLYRLLDKCGYNFKTCNQILDRNIKSGAMFYSSTHELTLDRQTILVQPLVDPLHVEINISKAGIFQHPFGELTISKTISKEFNQLKTEETVKIPPDLFPLVLRPWKTGDRINPLGLKGTIVIIDFFSDINLDTFTKTTTPSLCKGTNILWVCGHRISEDLKITTSDNMYNISISL